MKKKIFLLTTVLAASAMLFLSSCLKDKSHYVNFGDSGTWVDFPKGGPSNFSSQAITETPDTDANGTIVRVFAVNVASPQLQTIPTTVTLGIGDAATVTAYNASQTAVHYELMPTNAYKVFSKTITVAKGQLFGYDSIAFYKNLLDPAKSYMLPVVIASTTNGKLTANLNTLLYHFIGNDFAGTYEWYYTRHETPDSTSVPSSNRVDYGPTTVYPVTGTSFEVASGYYAQARYQVSYTETGAYPNATYSNITIAFYGTDEHDDFTAYGLSISQEPVFTSYPATSHTSGAPPLQSLTYAQFEKYLFRYYYATASRGIIDEYVKQ